MAVTKRLRYEILRRDGHTCGYCGAKAPDVKLTVDHVLPRALGGTDEPNNLVTACTDCNSGKAASNPDAPLVAEVDHKAVQWAQAMEVAITRRQAELADERKRVAEFDAAWNAWNVAGRPIPRDANWKNSISRFLAAGLDDEFLAGAVDTAVGCRKLRSAADIWPYFCGICWRELDARQKIAQRVMGSASRREDTDSDEELPLMDMFSVFLADALSSFALSSEVVQHAENVLWDVMGKTDRVYRDGHPDPSRRTAADGAPLSPFEQAVDYLRDATWRGMLPAQNAHAAAALEAEQNIALLVTTFMQQYLRLVLEHLGVPDEAIDRAAQLSQDAVAVGWTSADEVYEPWEPDVLAQLAPSAKEVIRTALAAELSKIGSQRSGEVVTDGAQ